MLMPSLTIHRWSESAFRSINIAHGTWLTLDSVTADAVAVAELLI